MGYFIYFVWKFVTDELQPMIDKQQTVLIKLIDQMRMLDQDQIRLQEKLNTVLEYRDSQILKEKKVKIIILSSLILSATLFASPIVHEFKNPSFSGKVKGSLFDYRKPRTFKKKGNRRRVRMQARNAPEREQIIRPAKFIRT